ncbi:hypothetical protein [Kingella negevensis]|uniref:hypothetical protein n=1 Tax=Kingella negevensis TaxID=1522312 RepID=UPI00254B1A9A|nr:hypothetical protein [Kingella negevensis]MDK4680411.1 hypothetical protein [Kingella negevensis]MDK4681866.1 hypothetical protein [Kingella negevensis]MDK4690063.1 hypothetical protein [Kingella negevensis]MDK4692591.1 hypothetical protein [Kingella negevensis]MDK4698890.1 hypothetical protein [Kingella negevensis]
MDNKTFISIEFWQLVSFLLSFLAVCWGFGKILLSQFQAQQDERQRQQDRLSENFEKLQTQFAEQKALLPEKFVLREDYIRNQAILEAKMDSIQKTLTDLYKMESAKK